MVSGETRRSIYNHAGPEAKWIGFTTWSRCALGPRAAPPWNDLSLSRYLFETRDRIINHNMLWLMTLLTGFESLCSFSPAQSA